MVYRNKPGRQQAGFLTSSTRLTNTLAGSKIVVSMSPTATVVNHTLFRWGHSGAYDLQHAAFVQCVRATSLVFYSL
jgi:hypothetical protein